MTQIDTKLYRPEYTCLNLYRLIFKSSHPELLGENFCNTRHERNIGI